jgi:hypothetical protein
MISPQHGDGPHRRRSDDLRCSEIIPIEKYARDQNRDRAKANRKTADSGLWSRQSKRPTGFLLQGIFTGKFY